MLLRRRFLVGASAIVAAQSVPSRTTFAQAPDRPITLVVGFPPGGTSDVTARIVGEHMARTLRVPVVVENRPGAGGAIAATAVARAPANGQTIMIVDPSTLAVNPLMSPDAARYDPIADFAPLAIIGETPLVVVVPNARPFRTVDELRAHLAANPGRANYASSGVGSVNHLAGEMFLAREGNLRAEHIAYRGGAPMMEALTKGEVDFGIAVLASAVAQISAGTVRAIALAGPTRNPAVASLPRAESLIVANGKMSSWLGVAGPRGIPAETTTTLNDAVNRALSDEAVRARLATAGIEPSQPLTPAQAAAFVAAEVDGYRRLRDELGARLRQ
jgi:tripartite-type tricarboxylate transporter receptor subunit TctC